MLAQTVACTTDFQPIIIAIATIITIQIPILVAAIVNYFRTRTDYSHSKARQYEQIRKLDDLTLITKNGFHGPPGPAGQPGAQGEPGRDATAKTE